MSDEQLGVIYRISLQRAQEIVLRAAKGRWALLAALFISAAHGQTEDRLAAQLRTCAGCHGADGNSTIAGTPSIAAQPRIFVENYLVMTREGIRGSAVMQELLKGVPDKEIVALASTTPA